MFAFVLAVTAHQTERMFCLVNEMGQGVLPVDSKKNGRLLELLCR